MLSQRNVLFLIILVALPFWACNKKMEKSTITIPLAHELLSDPDMLAISYGGYRHMSRDTQPTLAQIKEDMQILHEVGIKLVRTYNVHYAHAGNVLKAIHELKQEDPSFEMYVMLGIWIDCFNAWTDQPVDHTKESPENANEVARAIQLTNQYADIVRVMAVGNEAMVHWATTYFVGPEVILKWVQYLQEKKKEGMLDSTIAITSSDNWASWGGEEAYRKEALIELIHQVDYVSMHTYPMHDTHYNSAFWGLDSSQTKGTKAEQVDALMQQALGHAQAQYEIVKRYVESIAADKQVHIGETGWASSSDGFYGPDGSRAVDEYKSGVYHKLIRNWTQKEHIACFYFEAFDEPWKDANNQEGSENHFGQMNGKAQLKYAWWEHLDALQAAQLTRGGKEITRTYSGKLNELLKEVVLPAAKK